MDAIAVECIFIILFINYNVLTETCRIYYIKVHLIHFYFLLLLIQHLTKSKIKRNMCRLFRKHILSFYLNCVNFNINNII